jgi:hypothetical protein
MEIDGDPEVVWLAIATGSFLDGGNPARHVPDATRAAVAYACR